MYETATGWRSLRRRGHRRAGICAVLALIAALTASSRAFAQAMQPRQEAFAQTEYEDAVKLGFEEFTLGNYVEARARFGEAHKLNPSARTLRALGMVEYELKRYVEASQYLQEALASTVRPLTSEQRAQTEQLLSKSLGYVTRFRFAVKPANATLTIDGTPVAQDAARGVLMAAGEHVIEVNAANHQPARRTVQVLGGEEDQQLTIVLLAQHNEQTSPSPVKDQPKSSRAKAWIWGTVAAVLVGGAAVGLVLGLKKDSNSGEVNKGTTGIEITVPGGMALERR